MSFTSNTNIFKRCSKDIFSFPVKLKIVAQKQRLFSSRPCSARRPVGACQSWASATRPGWLGRQKTVTKSTEGLHVKQSKTSGMMTVSMCVFVEKDLKRFEMHWNVKITVTLDFDTEEELHDWDQVWFCREASSWIFLHAVAGLYLPSGTLQTENCEGTDCWSLPNLSSICRRCCPSKG